MKKFNLILSVLILFSACSKDDNENDEIDEQIPTYTYKVIDTGVEAAYNNTTEISTPAPVSIFYGQDADYRGFTPFYRDNGDGTIFDYQTGLTWQQDMGEKVTFAEAFTAADNSNLSGFSDWRVPSIKELYSLIMFYGQEGQENDESSYIPFINTEYFDQPFGDTQSGERLIDAQTWSATEYVSTTMNGDETVFGVNFVDGRIKGYPKYDPATITAQKMYLRMVRDKEDYGINDFVDNANGTISDLATGLMWQTADDGNTRSWQDAISYCENLDVSGYNDWRLPNIKELQSIVDYSKSPATSNSPAINSLFSCTEITDPDGNPGQYGYYWSGTTHLTGTQPGDHAAYIAFGKAQGNMNGNLLDVHGAGAQRSDPKSGEANEYPQYFGPQGDVQYVYNFVRAVRNIQ